MIITSKANEIPARPNYGIDAPKVIRNIFIAAGCLFLLALLVTCVKLPLITFSPLSLLSVGISCLFSAAWMLFYSLKGKYKYRDHLLSLISWRGDEQVLDVGTGKGLLMIGAAKRLDSGRSYGIDIWNAADLTGNSEANAMNNARAEGVADKVRIQNQNVTQMDFTDDFFDVITSNLCLHNIYNKQGRLKACAEIFRVLKPGGVVVIADFRHTGQYKAAFKALGMRIDLMETAYFNTFPPLTLVKATKSNDI